MNRASERFVYKSASLILTPDRPDTFRLQNLYSLEPGNGHASELLRQVAAEADKRGATLILTAKQYGNPRGLPTPQLIAFYGRYGFATTDSTMTRLPKEPHEQKS